VTTAMAARLAVIGSRGRPCLIVAIGLWAGFVVSDPCPAHAGQAVPRSLEVGGQTRTYRLYTPPGFGRESPAPLVLVLHGGGGDGAKMERLTAFSALAQREKFLVVYPDAMYRNWNDGRGAAVSRVHRERIDDLGFIATLLDALTREYHIDASRVFATGISNGAIFSHFLAAQLSSRIAAIAPVAGGIADPFYQRFSPDRPVSVLILQGTADPLVPYGGGGVLRGRRGKIIPTSARSAESSMRRR
jgi:polyhydroxybutyrate depolymerase